MADFRVALTGGAGSGKSTVAQMFAERGARVVDADALAHDLLEPGRPENDAVRAAFGPLIADSEGRILRPALRARVFSDPKARATLEAILHPPIRAALKQRSEGAEPYALLVIPLLAETGRPPFVDRVLVIDVDGAIQARRLAARGLTQATVAALLALQAPRARRLALADDTLSNDGERTALVPLVDDLHARYCALARASRAHRLPP